MIGGGRFAGPCAAGMLAFALALAGCAAEGPQAASPPIAADMAERVAFALADADEAQQAGQRDRLAAALRVISASGAAPLADAPGGDPVPGWMQAVGEERPATRGSPFGPGYRVGQLAAGKAARIEQLFLSGERAKVVLSAPGRAQLALRIRNAREQAVCDREGTPNHCQWVPMFTERHSIEIANHSSEPARYFLVIE